MNKAAFLNIIRQVAPIQDQEVEDLEELVASFPYCQTAHILLAKAAYDRGSMLSTQKLRRAAAHASNRQLLKRIVYAPPVLHNTVEQEVAEPEETTAVFGSVSENEAKNGFPEVAPEEGILIALDGLSDEDLHHPADATTMPFEAPSAESFLNQTAAGSALDLSCDETSEPTEDPSDWAQPFGAIEIPLDGPVIDLETSETTGDGQPGTIEGPADFLTQVPDEAQSALPEESVVEEDAPAEPETPQYAIYKTEDDVEEAAWQDGFEAEQLPEFIGEQTECETISLEVMPEWEDGQVTSPMSLEEPLTESILSINPEPESLPQEALPLITEPSGLEAIPGTDGSFSSQEEDVHPAPAASNPTGMASVHPDSDLAAIVDSELLSDPIALEEALIARETPEAEPEESISPREANTIDKEEVIGKAAASKDGVEAVVDEDELFSLIQIDSLATLAAPIPGVNLSHAEIISELTSKAEPLGFKAEEQVLQEEAVTAAIAQEQPAVTNPDLVEFVAELDGKDAASLSEDGHSAFPMLQTVASASASQEKETEKDPYLSIFYHNSLAYWMDSSRMGETIQLRDELTTSKPYYFQPDLILEHVKGNGVLEQVAKPVAKLDVQLSIIDQFLKSNPKLKSMAHLQQKSEPQEDLSAKSSKIKKNLASENLALIFIKQGKARKAVKIYEQLIVKFPEKKSYFAEQIEKLRNEL